MDSDGPALKQLTRAECFRLMASAPVGRIIYTRQALPAVDLVSFALDGGDIIIRTDRDGKLAAGTRGAVVAFEADSVDTDRRTGWSVTVVGPSTEVTDPDEIDRLERTGLSSWAPAERGCFIRISPGILNGLRLTAPGSARLHPALRERQCA
jgi:uncharacterized protein